MTVEATGEVYARSPRALWRDTGRHVLALLSGSPGHRPVLLSGVAVRLWRALEDPGELDVLAARLRLDEGRPSSRAEVASTVADMRAYGLVATTPEAGRDEPDAPIGR